MFTSYNGNSINRIVRLNTNGAIDLTFNIGTGFDGNVWDVQIQSDGKILVGGSFYSYNGNSYEKIIRLNINGSVDSSFNPLPGNSYGNISSIVVQPDNKIIVAGAIILNYNYTFYNRLFRINSNGTIDNTFTIGTGFNNTVYHANLQDEKVIAAGFFTNYDSTGRNRIARLNNCVIRTGVDTIVTCDSITWIDGITYSNSTNTPSFTLVAGAANGCDSIVSLNLTITNSASGNNTQNICQGDSILIGGNYQSTTGVYYDSLQTISGCDSIVAVTLNVMPSFLSSIYDTICHYDSILIGGIYQNTSGTYYDSLQTVNGCDSIIEVFLSVYDSLSANFTKALDPADSLNLLVTNLSTGNNLKFLWDFGDGNTSTQAFPSHVYAIIGVYNLCLTVTDSLTNCSTMLCDSTTALKSAGIKTIQVITSVPKEIINKEDSWVRMYPNPSINNSFMIHLKKHEIVNIIITNMAGQIVYNQSSNNTKTIVNTSNWSKGIYNVRIESPSLIKVIKAIIQ